MMWATVAPAALNVGVVAAQGPTPTPAPSTTQTWEVQVGGGDTPTTPPGPPLFEAQAYGPGPVIIRVGDTVSWKFAGVHTVTVNSGKPPLPLIVPGSAPGELMLGPAFFPAGVTGTRTNYDGTAQVSSGAPEEDPTQLRFELTFTRPGLYGYTCELHPGMRAEVEVREANLPLPETPAQAWARGQATLASLVGKMKQDVQGLRPETAGTVHTALAGVGNGFGASALQFVNGNKTVRRGDTVVWTSADPFEIHTVTFAGSAPPPEFIVPRPQPSGPPQLVIPANVASPVGGDTYSGQGYANSGIFGNGGSYALRFDAPAGSYQYLCIVHPWMMGTITVSG
jgi:plastocyanin